MKQLKHQTAGMCSLFLMLMLLFSGSAAAHNSLNFPVHPRVPKRNPMAYHIQDCFVPLGRINTTMLPLTLKNIGLGVYVAATPIIIHSLMQQQCEQISSMTRLASTGLLQSLARYKTLSFHHRQQQHEFAQQRYYGYAMQLRLSGLTHKFSITVTQHGIGSLATLPLDKINVMQYNLAYLPGQAILLTWPAVNVITRGDKDKKHFILQKGYRFVQLSATYLIDYDRIVRNKAILLHRIMDE